MGETGHAMSSALASAVRTTERLCGLPAVATLDWSERAARALSVLLAPSRACVLVLTAEPSGRIVTLEASGCGSCLTREQAEAAPSASWHTESGHSSESNGIELAIRSRADRLRELGFRLDGLTPGHTMAGTAARLGGTELWRTAPIGTLWVGSDVSDLLMGAARLDTPGVGPGRFVVVQIGLLGHGASGPRKASIDNQATLTAVMPLLARRALLALGTQDGSPAAWLTVREQQVLEQLVLGKSVRQIAEELGRSPHTVHDHVKSLHRKLGASSRGELIARALGYLEEGTRAQEHEKAASVAEPKLKVVRPDEKEPPEIVIREHGIGTRSDDR